MRNLIYKELKLSIHKFFLILPFMLSLLMFIPQWIYTIAFMYFFWISIINICSGYIAKQDNSFTAMLPVTKSDIVKSKIVAILSIEGLHLFTGIVMGVVHNQIYGTYNFFMDMNLAFFSAMFVMFAIFNIIFFPWYFKTAYFYGKPVIYGAVATLIFAFVIEYGTIRFAFMRNIFEGEMSIQWIVTLVSAILVGILTFVTVKKSVRNFTSLGL